MLLGGAIVSEELETLDIGKVSFYGTIADFAVAG